MISQRDRKNIVQKKIMKLKTLFRLGQESVSIAIINEKLIKPPRVLRSQPVSAILKSLLSNTPEITLKNRSQHKVHKLALYSVFDEITWFFFLRKKRLRFYYIWSSTLVSLIENFLVFFRFYYGMVFIMVFFTGFFYEHTGNE